MYLYLLFIYKNYNTKAVAVIVLNRSQVLFFACENCNPEALSNGMLAIDLPPADILALNVLEADVARARK